MTSDDLCFMTATDLVRAFRDRSLSPVELVQALLARIERVNPRINAFCTLAAERALDEARRAERSILRGEPAGILAGVPVGFKDVTETAGIRTTYGSRVFAEHVPAEDAVVVERARTAGAVVLGKTNTPEFACKGTTDNGLFGVTRNPWDPGRVAGGSSGGSAAALAAGLVPLAEGNDLAGSIRIPASCCGVVGFRPSLGRVPCHPTPNGWTGFLTHGPLARSVADAALFYSVLAGADARDPQTPPLPPEPPVTAAGDLRGVRAAWSPTLGHAPLDPQVRQLTARAAAALGECGAVVEEADPGIGDTAALFVALSAPWRAGLCGRYLPQWREQMDPVLVERISGTAGMGAVEYERAQQQRTELWHTVRRFFERFDVLLTPTTSVAAFPIGRDFPPEIDGRVLRSQLDWYPFTHPFSLTGQPAISVPAGWTREGLPAGLQIVGRRFEDITVLRVAAAFEAARPWCARRPAL